MAATKQQDAEESDLSVDQWFVYILRCADDSFYTGITKDLVRRLGQHNAGTASRYTRARLPVAMEYSEPQASHSLALKTRTGHQGTQTRSQGIADKIRRQRVTSGSDSAAIHIMFFSSRAVLFGASHRDSTQ